MNRSNEASLQGPLLIALICHIAIGVLLSLQIRFHHYEHNEEPPMPVMEARVIEAKPRLPSKPPVTVPAPTPEPEVKPEPVPEPEKTVVDTAAEQRLAEQQAADKKVAAEKIAAEQRRVEADKLALEVRKKKEQEEREKLAEDERNKKIEADKKLKQEADLKAKTEADLKAKEDAQRKLDEQKKKDEADKKLKADADKKRKLEEQKKRQQEEDLLAQQLEQESEATAQRKQQILSEVGKYKALIYSKVQRNWIIPSNPVGACALKVRIGPGGIVLDVAQGSGDDILCRSAVAAVRKSEPLPVPTDPEVFEVIRNINFNMDPKDKVQ